MSKTITVRGLQIGAGMPKIIVPIAEKDDSSIIRQAQSFAGRRIDMAEWRADFYGQAGDTQHVLHTLSALRKILGNTPLLFTFRTKNEGGEQELSPAAYTALNKAVAESGQADLVDVEVFAAGTPARENIANIHVAGALAVGSYHDFHATPPAKELLERMKEIQAMGADILKIAVMPTCAADVLALLAASAEMHEKYAVRPLIAVSMSARGAISRLAGEVFGSAATFGMVGQGSAPGQLPVEQLAQVLEILHQAEL